MSETEAAARLPDTEWVHSNVGGDRVVCARHPSVVGNAPGYAFGVAGLVVAAVTLPATGLELVGVGVTVASSLALIAGIHLRRVNTWYVVTDERVLLKRGVVSVSTNPLSLTSILEMEVRRPAYLRPFGVGHVRIFAASTDSVDVDFSYAPGAGKFVSAVKRGRHHARR